MYIVVELMPQSRYRILPSLQCTFVYSKSALLMGQFLGGKKTKKVGNHLWHIYRSPGNLKKEENYWV